MRVLNADRLKGNGGEVSGISNITKQSRRSQGRAQRDDFRLFTCCCFDETEVKSTPRTLYRPIK